MLREIHIAGLVQKNHRWDAGALPAQELLDLATLEGARAMGQEASLGSVEVGKRADFSLVRLDHPTLQPARPEAIVSHLAYSAADEAIDSVYVDGECVVEHRRLVRGDWETIRRDLEARRRPPLGRATALKRSGQGGPRAATKASDTPSASAFGCARTPNSATLAR